MVDHTLSGPAGTLKTEPAWSKPVAVRIRRVVSSPADRAARRDRLRLAAACAVAALAAAVDFSVYTALLWVPALVVYSSSFDVVTAFGCVIQASITILALVGWYRAGCTLIRPQDCHAAPGLHVWTARCLLAGHWTLIVFLCWPFALGVLIFQHHRPDFDVVLTPVGTAVLAFTYLALATVDAVVHSLFLRADERRSEIDLKVGKKHYLFIKASAQR